MEMFRLLLSSRRRRMEWLALAAACLLVAALLAIALHRDHTLITRVEESRLAGQAKVVEENLERQLEGVSGALSGVRDAFDPARRETWPAFSERMALLTTAMPGLRTMAILDAGGTVVASSREELMGRNFRHRGYFDVPRRAADRQTLYVSAPMKATLDGHVVFTTKAIVAPDGRFAGIVAATLNPDYFDVLLRSVLYATDMRSALVHGDGRVFVNAPVDARGPGLDASAPGSALGRFGQGGLPADLLRELDPATNEERMVALRRVDGAALGMDKPLVVAVSRDVAAVYAPWHERATRFALLFLVLVAASSATLRASHRRRIAIARLAAESARERQEASARLSKSEERLALALEGSGLALFDWDIRANVMFHSAQAAALRGEEPVERSLSAQEAREHVHPDDLPGLLANMRSSVTGTMPPYHAEFRLRTTTGGWVWVRARGRVVERESHTGKALRMAGTYANVNDRKLTEDRLRYLAEFDTLTDLPNRALFHERLRQAMTRTRPPRTLAVLFLDIDRFKQINDTLGHEAGDELLKEFARRMQATVRLSDTVARLAGDEFTIILENLRDPQDAAVVAGKLVAALGEPVVLEGAARKVTASIGVATHKDGDTADALLRRADAALYEAKRRGRDGFVLERDAGGAAQAPESPPSGSTVH